MRFRWEQLGAIFSLALLLSIWSVAQTPTQTEPHSFNDLLAIEDPNARLTALQQFLKANPNSELTAVAREAIVASYAQIGELQLGENNIEKALEAFQRAFRALPKQISDRFFEEIIIKIPMAVSARGYRAEAVRLGQTLETRFADEPARLAALGEFYLTIEAAGEAIQTLENAARLAPEDARLHRALGAAYRMGLRIDEAVAAYQLTVLYDAKDRRAYYDLANLYRSQGAYDDALKLYKKQLEIDPKHSASYKGLALVYTALGKEDQAAAALNQVRDLRGSSDDITQDILLQTQLAFYRLAQGKLKAARQAAEAALLVEPRFSWARIAAAEVELAEGKYFEAERHLLTAQQYANFPTLAFTLGKLYLVVEDFDGAAEQFTKAFSYSANDQFTTRLGGVRDVKSADLKELLAPEHQAAVFLAEPPTSEELFKIAESLTRTNVHLQEVKPAKPAVKEKEAQKEATKEPDEELLEQAARTFVEAEGTRRSFRALYMARRLAQAGKALPLAIQLAEQALELAEVATEAEGSLRDYPNFDREGRLRIFRGRAQDARGWALFKAGRNRAAVSALSEAVIAYGPLPEHKQALRHLAAAKETAGDLPVALELHLAAYEPPAEKASVDVNRTVIELLYRKVHGSLNGLNDRLGQPLSAKTAELIADTAQLASTPKTELSESAPTVAANAPKEPEKTAATDAAANAEFNVNQLLVSRAKESPATPDTSATRPALPNTARNQVAKTGTENKESLRLGQYGIPVNSTARKSAVPPPVANKPEEKPAQEPVDQVAELAKELPKEQGKTLATEPNPQTETTAVNSSVKSISNRPAPATGETTTPASTETSATKPIVEAAAPAPVEPVKLPELDQERLAKLPLVLALTSEPELLAASFQPTPLDEPPAPAIATPAHRPTVTIRYEEAPNKAVRESTDNPDGNPPQPVSTRPRRVSELVPVKEPTTSTRKRRVTTTSGKP